VQLWATVGRFRCRNSLCPRKVFCERLPRFARAYSRQTERASEIVRLIGYVAGGVPGFGDSSLDYPLPPAMTRCCAAFDKRRFRNCRSVPCGIWVSMIGLGAKARSMGTILVDVELRHVVYLLPDRAVDSFSEWLRRHPDTMTVSRDRSGIYAEGATLGAPQAQQVADRFHLMLNLSATMERVLEERTRQLVLPPLEAPGGISELCRNGDGAEAPAAVSAPPLTQSQLRREWEARSIVFGASPLTGRYRGAGCNRKDQTDYPVRPRAG